MIVAKDRSREQWFSSKFARHCDTTTNPEKLPGLPSACVSLKQCKTRSFLGQAFCQILDRARLLLFHHALQGMLVLACKIHHLRYLRLGDLVGEYSALPDSVVMNVEHDLGRGFDVLLEELLQNVNDKFHRRVIVVQNQDPIEIRALCLRLDLGDDGCGRTAAAPGAVLIVAHS